jgi:hypothetical protein
MIAATGPKISSWAMVASGATSQTTVGSTKYPVRPGAVPPASSSPPSRCATEM